MKAIKNAKLISSCGSTGIYIDGNLCDTYDVTSLEAITSLIDRTFEIQYTNEDGSVSSEPEFKDGFDEWTINVK